MAKKPTDPLARMIAAQTKRNREAAALESRKALAARQELVPIAGTTIVPDARYSERTRRPYGEGPWKAESEKVAWTDPATGYPCIILRQPGGELAGYVGVEPHHALAGWAADALPGSINDGLHRPVNYGAACQEAIPERISICHVPRARHNTPSQALHQGREPGRSGQEHGEDLAWWFGMTMDGPQDYIPRRDTSGLSRDRGQVYRDEHFVCAQVTVLAGKLKALDDAAKSTSGSTPGADTGALPAPKREDRA
ncbi:MAG: hypothetical protein B7Y89_15880 [Novosphingobium sp. 32-60-15]|uniref:hypothetical protein n=1 Tax=unclassified Novosphingobium TaxID=2644732 RepID=UPI000BC5F15A|nr:MULTISPECIES: hypothetical protein [unclassified Novosphingobium]OYX60598.1 MAG: hypothetical protein B7Y89_15880 [Novosphingobium sp. 32-60-15]